MTRPQSFRTPLLLALVSGLGLLGLGCSGEDHYYLQDPVAYPVTSVAVADLDADGRIDLVASIHGEGAPSDPGWVTVRRQDPTRPGVYYGPEWYDAGANPARIVAAPLAAGARPGLVVVDRQMGYQASPANTVKVFFPDPARAGILLSPVSLPLGARNGRDAAVGDLDGDGAPDVAVAADGAASVLVFRQSPAGAFQAPVALAVAGEPTAVAVADLDGDGLSDLVVATTADAVSVLIQDAAHPGTFLPKVDLPAGSRPVAVKVADLDGDGRLDIVVADQGTETAPAAKGVTVLLQAKAPAAAGTFLPAVGYPTGDDFASDVAVGDLDGDGLPDLAVACSGAPGDPGSIAVLLQDGSAPGTFKAATNLGGYQGPSSVAIADVDGDGLNDLVIGDGYLYVRKQVPGKPAVFGVPLQFRQ